MSESKASVSLALKLAKDMGTENHLQTENYKKWSDTMSAIWDDVYAGTGNNMQTVQELVFDNPPPTPQQLQANPLTAAQERRLKQATNFATQLIKNSVKGGNEVIINNQNAYNMWARLREHHINQTAANKAKLEREIEGTFMSAFRGKGKGEEQAMQEYLTKLESLRDRFVAVVANLLCIARSSNCWGVLLSWGL